MSRSESDPARRAIDWRAWIALAWAGWFGWLYFRMILDARGAAILGWLRRMLAHS